MTNFILSKPRAARKAHMAEIVVRNGHAHIHGLRMEITAAGIGLFGMAPAAIGLGGVTAYAVAQRTKEIGIRVAVGARPRDIVCLVLRQGGVIVAAGAVLGQLSAYGVAAALASLIHERASRVIPPT